MMPVLRLRGGGPLRTSWSSSR